ncbi:MAG: hypothetical protein HQK77_07945 [Desulfobacterales bacterium]|nr:hypothetical protein [Desulfobacterales bacterium]
MAAAVWVVVYSQDQIRGGILTKLCQRESISARLENRLDRLQKTIETYLPQIIVMDIKNALASEINALKNLCEQNKNCFWIVIGGSQDVTQMVAYLHNDDWALCVGMEDPFNPEAICKQIKKRLDQQINPKPKLKTVTPKESSLKSDLMRFLKLD